MNRKLSFKSKYLIFYSNLFFFNYKIYSKCNICCCNNKNNEKLNVNINENNDNLEIKNNDIDDLENKKEEDNNEDNEENKENKDNKDNDKKNDDEENKNNDNNEKKDDEEYEVYNLDNEDTVICKNIDEFKIQFNERKKLIKFKNNELTNKLQNNNPNDNQFNHYFDIYKKMTDDIFTHEVSVDLTIYIYILDLIGIINALNNIIKKEKLQYWMFSKFMYDKDDFGGTLTSKQFGCLKFEEIDGNNYNLHLDYMPPKENFTRYYSGQLDIECESFKYLRCSGCNDNNCVSCKLRKFLENEYLLDYFINIFNNQSKDSNSENSLKIKNLIYLSLKKQYKNIEMYGWNNNKHKNYDKLFKYYELTNKIAFNFKKCVLLEWALTIEFLDRFIKEILDKGEEFKIYRSIQTKEKSLKLVDFFESTSMFGPVFISTNPVYAPRTNFFNISDFKLYRCLFHYIISPVKKSMFTALSNGVDYEQEIGYIPINQEWKRINNLENDIENNNLRHLDSRNKLIDDLILKFLLKNFKKDHKYKCKKIHIFEEFHGVLFQFYNDIGTFNL